MDGNPLVEESGGRAAAPEWKPPTPLTAGAALAAAEQPRAGAAARTVFAFRPPVGPGPQGQVLKASPVVAPAATPELSPAIPNLVAGPAARPASSAAENLLQAPATAAVPADSLPEGAFFPAGGLSRPKAERGAPEEALVGRVLDQRYRIEEAIGYGGMGVVFKARHVIIDKVLAIKLLRSEHASQPDVVKRFLLEAQLASRIKHPNIVDISDYGQIPGGTAYYVMEFLTGETLAHRVDRIGRLEPGLALEVAVQILAGLQAAHAGKIIHRDLKSENIFLCETPDGAQQIKILDFGIARIRDKKTRLTAHGALIGTPAYMSPEQAQGQEVDERSDLYAFGVILFEMLAGSVPFRLPTVAMVLSAQIYDTPPSLREVEPDAPDVPNLERFIRILLAKNRDERPQSASDALSLLKAAAELDASAGTSSRRRPTVTLGSWAVAEAGPASGGPDTAAPTISDAAADIDAAIARAVSPSGRIERRPSVIVQREAGVERIAPPNRPATGEITPRGPMTGMLAAPRSSGPPTLLIIAAAASIGAAITVTLYKQYYRKPAPAAISTSSAAPAPAPMMIKLTFESDPPGAEVLRDGAEVLGTAPFVFEVAPQGPSRRYVFRLAGYEDAVTDVAPGKTNERVRIHMRPLVPPGPAPSPAATPTPVLEEAKTTPAATASPAVKPSTPKPKVTRNTTKSPNGPAVPEKPVQTPPEDDGDMGELKNPFPKK